MKTLLPLALVMCAFGTLASGDARSQAFDCRDIRSRDEARICDSNKLSRLDSQLNAAYRRALARNHGRQAIRIQDEQRDWLSSRRRCGSRWSCLEGMYRSRIAELRSE